MSSRTYRGRVKLVTVASGLLVVLAACDTQPVGGDPQDRDGQDASVIDDEDSLPADDPDPAGDGDDLSPPGDNDDCLPGNDDGGLVDQAPPTGATITSGGGRVSSPHFQGTITIGTPATLDRRAP